MQYAADQENEINISVEGYDEERYMHVNVKKIMACVACTEYISTYETIQYH